MSEFRWQNGVLRDPVSGFAFARVEHLPSCGWAWVAYLSPASGFEETEDAACLAAVRSAQSAATRLAIDLGPLCNYE